MNPPLLEGLSLLTNPVSQRNPKGDPCNGSTESCAKAGHSERGRGPIRAYGKHRAAGNKNETSLHCELNPHETTIGEPDQRLDRFALGEVVAERRERAVRLFEQVIGVEPPVQQADRRRRRARVALLPPRLDLLANLGDERWDELVVGRAAERFVSWEPPL